MSLDDMWTWVEAQVRFGARRPGTPAGLANEDYLEGELKRLGLENVRKEAIPISVWDKPTARLSVAESQSWSPIDVFSIPYCADTNPKKDFVEAPLVYVSADGFQTLPESLAGRIVVTDISFPELNPKLLLKLAMGTYDPDGNLMDVKHPATWVRMGWHVYREAVKRGALGFVGILKDQPGGTCRMYGPYGFREHDILDKPIPGVWAGRASGARLREAARSGQGMARLSVKSERYAGKTHNVIAEIPGKGSTTQSNECVVLTCHHDSPFTSPVEDASGIAVVLELAKRLLEAPINRRVIVLLTAGHFYGSIGARSFIRDQRADVVARAAFMISIEHIAHEAIENEKGELVPTGRPEPSAVFISFNDQIRDITLRGLSAHNVDRSILLPAEGPLGNYPPTDGGDWYPVGVPIINFISNPVYLLTDDDAMKWIDKPRMARVAAAFEQIVRELDGVGRDELRTVDAPLRRLAMQALGILTSLKTTAFGTKPLH